jgi:hypothetical protein
MIATNTDVDYDPQETTEKVSPMAWTAGAEDAEINEDTPSDTIKVRRYRAEPGSQSDHAP